MGATRSAIIGTNGSYSIDVNGMTPPFVFRATGTAGTRTYEIHAGATQADVGGVIQYTVTNATTGTPVPGHVGQPYVANRSIEFDGMSLEMRGLPAAGDRVEVRPVTTTTDIFSVVQGAIDALRYGGTNQSAHQAQAMARAITEVDAGHDRVLLARGRAGEWLNRADSMDLLMNNRSTDLELEESRLVDLDMVKGISDFKNKELALNAGLQAYATVQRMSLFDYIK